MKAASFDNVNPWIDPQFVHVRKPDALSSIIVPIDPHVLHLDKLFGFIELMRRF